MSSVAVTVELMNRIMIHNSAVTARGYNTVCAAWGLSIQEFFKESMHAGCQLVTKWIVNTMSYH